jgi:phospholipid/cholesterol/gamma-HCH transport system ATP-binding protein
VTDPSNIKLRVSGLTKTFGDITVLSDVSLALPAGKRSVMIGPAASGKSVLMKCLIGLYAPDDGAIEVDGRDLSHLKGRERAELVETFGMLFQQGGLFDSLPVWENITFKLINRQGMDRESAKTFAKEKLAMVNLAPETADLFPTDLSGGMQKRVGVARAIAGDPSLLLLDEPTAGLDPITTNQINAMIGHTVSELGATALSITSVLHEGQVLWAGPTSEIDQADNPYLQQMINGRAEGPIRMRLRHRAE